MFRSNSLAETFTRTSSPTPSTSPVSNISHQTRPPRQLQNMVTSNAESHPPFLSLSLSHPVAKIKNSAGIHQIREIHASSPMSMLSSIEARIRNFCIKFSPGRRKQRENSRQIPTWPMEIRLEGLEKVGKKKRRERLQLDRETRRQ